MHFESLKVLNCSSYFILQVFSTAKFHMAPVPDLYSSKKKVTIKCVLLFVIYLLFH